MQPHRQKTKVTFVTIIAYRDCAFVSNENDICSLPVVSFLIHRGLDHSLSEVIRINSRLNASYYGHTNHGFEITANYQLLSSAEILIINTSE